MSPQLLDEESLLVLSPAQKKEIVGFCDAWSRHLEFCGWKRLLTSSEAFDSEFFQTFVDAWIEHLSLFDSLLRDLQRRSGKCQIAFDQAVKRLHINIVTFDRYDTVEDLREGLLTLRRLRARVVLDQAKHVKHDVKHVKQREDDKMRIKIPRSVRMSCLVRL